MRNNNTTKYNRESSREFTNKNHVIEHNFNVYISGSSQSHISPSTEEWQKQQKQYTKVNYFFNFFIEFFGFLLAHIYLHIIQFFRVHVCIENSCWTQCISNCYDERFWIHLCVCVRAYYFFFSVAIFRFIIVNLISAVCITNTDTHRPPSV